MPKTHKNFKSISPKVNSANDIYKHVGLALIYQHMFIRRTTPWERSLWDEEELQKFKVNLEEVDRLYYIHHNDCGCNEVFTLAGRSDYKGKQVYFEMNAGCDYTGFHCEGHGNIFVSMEANLFMKLILTNSYPIDHIYKSLAEDGIETNALCEYDKVARMFWTSAPMLKYLCHETVYENKEYLSHYPNVLPKALKESLDEYIRVKEAKDEYENWTAEECDYT